MKRPILLAACLLLALLLACNLPAPTPASPAAGTAENRDTSSPPAPLPGNVIDPQDLAYLGAFRLPESGERPYTFELGYPIPVL